MGLTLDQYESCWEHTMKDCNKCLFKDCPFAINDGDGFEEEEDAE